MTETVKASSMYSPKDRWVAANVVMDLVLWIVIIPLVMTPLLNAQRPPGQFAILAVAVVLMSAVSVVKTRQAIVDLTAYLKANREI